MSVKRTVPHSGNLGLMTKIIITTLVLPIYIRGCYGSQTPDHLTKAANLTLRFRTLYTKHSTVFDPDYQKTQQPEFAVLCHVGLSTTRTAGE